MGLFEILLMRLGVLSQDKLISRTLTEEIQEDLDLQNSLQDILYDLTWGGQRQVVAIFDGAGLVGHDIREREDGSWSLTAVMFLDNKPFGRLKYRASENIVEVALNTSEKPSHDMKLAACREALRSMNHSIVWKYEQAAEARKANQSGTTTGLKARRGRPSLSVVSANPKGGSRGEKKRPDLAVVAGTDFQSGGPE